MLVAWKGSEQALRIPARIITAGLEEERQAGAPADPTRISALSEGGVEGLALCRDESVANLTAALPPPGPGPWGLEAARFSAKASSGKETHRPSLRAQVQAKLENAEVLELTVRRVQGALRGRAREREQLQAEASERFAAGYIQCMHEVHTFVSTCQAIDATVAAELLNHLLESMPLREGSSFRDLLGDALAGPPGTLGLNGWPAGGVPGSPLPSPPGPGDDLCSDLEETPEAELSRAPAEGPDLVPAALGSLTAARIAQSVWRPW
ncbi:transcription cofactor HES-6 [Carlito syrichta]|uniref:Transcription cofactor HES-6 n=1 Tax=Carlito syrichta TaxID=1868482 RepID=A0A3Q0E0R4_CARSF|nr:transcription cofactor HES-6 [Carlito syrichta]